MDKLEFIPKNEIQTREWFCYHLNEFEYSIVESQRPFPDYTLRDGSGNIILTELEYVSSNFVNHGHDPNGCDLVMCWIHDENLSLPVFELSTKTMYESGKGATEFEAGFDKGGEYLQLDKEIIRKCSDEIDTFRKSFADYTLKGFKAKKEYQEMLYGIKKDTGYSMGFMYVVAAIRRNSNQQIIEKLDKMEIYPSTILQLVSGKKCYL